MVEEGSSDHAGAESQKEITMLKNLIKLLKDEEGATALEYGLMAAAVAGVLIVVAYFLGGRVSNGSTTSPSTSASSGRFVARAPSAE